MNTNDKPISPTSGLSYTSQSYSDELKTLTGYLKGRLVVTGEGKELKLTVKAERNLITRVVASLREFFKGKEYGNEVKAEVFKFLKAGENILTSGDERRFKLLAKRAGLLDPSELKALKDQHGENLIKKVSVRALQKHPELKDSLQLSQKTVTQLSDKKEITELFENKTEDLKKGDEEKPVSSDEKETPQEEEDKATEGGSGQQLSDEQLAQQDTSMTETVVPAPVLEPSPVVDIAASKTKEEATEGEKKQETNLEEQQQSSDQELQQHPSDNKELPQHVSLAKELEIPITELKIPPIGPQTPVEVNVSQLPESKDAVLIKKDVFVEETDNKTETPTKLVETPEISAVPLSSTSSSWQWPSLTTITVVGIGILAAVGVVLWLRAPQIPVYQPPIPKQPPTDEAKHQPPIPLNLTLLQQGGTPDASLSPFQKSIQFYKTTPKSAFDPLILFQQQLSSTAGSPKSEGPIPVPKPSDALVPIPQQPVAGSSEFEEVLQIHGPMQDPMKLLQGPIESQIWEVANKFTVLVPQDSSASSATKQSLKVGKSSTNPLNLTQIDDSSGKITEGETEINVPDDKTPGKSYTPSNQPPGQSPAVSTPAASTQVPKVPAKEPVAGNNPTYAFFAGAVALVAGSVFLVWRGLSKGEQEVQIAQKLDSKKTPATKLVLEEFLYTTEFDQDKLFYLNQLFLEPLEQLSTDIERIDYIFKQNLHLQNALLKADEGGLIRLRSVTKKSIQLALANRMDLSDSIDNYAASKKMFYLYPALIDMGFKADANNPECKYDLNFKDIETVKKQIPKDASIRLLFRLLMSNRQELGDQTARTKIRDELLQAIKKEEDYNLLNNLLSFLQNPGDFIALKAIAEESVTTELKNRIEKVDIEKGKKEVQEEVKVEVETKEKGERRVETIVKFVKNTIIPRRKNTYGN